MLTLSLESSILLPVLADLLISLCIMAIFFAIWKDLSIPLHNYYTPTNSSSHLALFFSFPNLSGYFKLQGVECECYTDFTSMQASSNLSKSPRHLQPSPDSSRKFQVICRVRPLQEAESSQDISISADAPSITIYNHKTSSSKEYTFHRVYADTTKQEDFTRSMTDQIFLNCLENGKGCLILSYGVTNSGKTYTILGTAKEPGILPALVARFEEQMLGKQIRIRAMEIYNDDLYCLRNGERLQIREVWGNYEFVGGCEYEEVTKATSRSIIEAFIRNRKAAETNANRASSRSHAIFMIQCGEYHIGITDLAGNERYGTNHNFQETFSINKNLLVLGKCIHAFRDCERLPYRESKLTIALMEYFKPNYKIFMITHLNRTGKMFHENINVLDYAAVSTKVKHINADKNPSIMKSVAKEKKEANEMSEWKEKREREGVSEFKSAERRHNQILLERYKCYIMGVNTQAQEDLDRYFKEEDEKDMKFLEELKATQFVSPNKSNKLWLDKLEAQSRIKLRQIFLQEMRLEKEDKMKEAATEMGPSMQKPIQNSPLKLDPSTEKVSCFTLMGTSMKKQPAISSSHASGQSQEMITPSKLPSNPQSQSYLKKVMRNPALMIQSGFRMITNFNQMANNMMESFKGIIGKQQEQQEHLLPAEKVTHLRKQMERLATLEITRQSGMKIVVTGESVYDRIRSQQKSMQKVIVAEEIEFKDQQKERDNNANNVPFHSQESTILVNRDLNRSSYFARIQQLNEEDSIPVRTAEFNQNVKAVNVNDYVQNTEESMLLDGLRSDKDASTNRTSDIDLLQSEQSLKNKPIQPIPESMEETVTKSPFRSAMKANQVSNYIREKENRRLANVHLNNHQLEHKHSETGFKSTQETMVNHYPTQLGLSRSKSKVNPSKLSKSKAKVKAAEQERSVSKANTENSNSVDEVKRFESKRGTFISSAIGSVKTSGIKTRRMRKNEEPQKIRNKSHK